MTTNDALALLDRAGKAAAAYDRPDLGGRVRQVRDRVTDPRLRVLVVGEFKQGKSSLVNGLVNATICPVDDDVATSVPTALHYADEPTAVAVHLHDDPDSTPSREVIDVDAIGGYVSEAGNPANGRRLAAVEVGLPRPLLRSGMVLVDTPGVGGLGSVHSATTVAALSTADAVLLCTDASQELTEAEMKFLDIVVDLCPTVACVLTKTDFYPAWRKIADLNGEHLARRNIAAPVIGTSASLRRRALARNDHDLNEESGYPHLLAFLKDQVVDRAAELSRLAVGHVVRGMCDQLLQRFTAEREALTDPAGSAALVVRLEETQQRLKTLREQSARWQQTLADGFADLVADTDHDLRTRMRRVTKLADAAAEEHDPTHVWEQLEAWLYQTTAGELSAHYSFATQRARQVAEDVADQFAADAPTAAPQIEVSTPLDALRRIDPAKQPEATVESRAGKGLTAMRGSFGGLMMIGVLGGTVGLGLINPLSLGFGVLVGRKALKDESKRALALRRQQAKQACRAYIDEVTFVIGKDARDGIRRMQRTLRDTFAAYVADLQRTTSDALTAAQQAVQVHQSERAGRLQNIDAELARIRALRAAAEGLS